MSNSTYNKPKRITNDKELGFTMMDSENPIKLRPAEYSGDTFFGQYGKIMTAQFMLDNETKTKYGYDYQAHFKARLEVGSGSFCFNDCISDVSSTTLSSFEKNCMRECYTKRLSSRDDIMLYFIQAYGDSNAARTRYGAI